MENIKKFFVDFVNTRKVTYYVVLGLAVLQFIMGIVATAALSAAGATALPLVFTLLGLLVFAGLSLIGREKIGAGAVSFAGFISLIVLLCEVFEYFLGVIQDQAMSGFNLFAIEGMTALIVCAAIFVVCAIAANVLSWLKLSKPKAEETVAPEETDGEAAKESADAEAEKTEEAE